MNTDNVNAALAYIQAGGWVFPTRWDGKRFMPLNKWSTESTNDPDTIRSWAIRWPGCAFCANLGRAGHAVLDVDMKKGKDGSATLDALIWDEGLPLPDTFKVLTPSGGWHLWFIGQVKNTAGRLGLGLDTRGDGGMVPVPGSMVEGKGLYAVAEDRPMAQLPEWVQERAGAPSARVERKPVDPSKLDHPTDVDLARRWLVDEAPTAIEGQGGDDTTYRAACRVRDFGLSEDTCFALMMEWNELKARPTWMPEALEEKVRSAYRYARGEIGSSSVEEMFGPAEESAAGTQRGPKPLSAYHAGKAPVRDWVIEDWLPAGAWTFLTGEGGTGKSLLAMELCLSVGSGGPFLGLPVAKPMPVLMVLCEDSDNEIHRRLDSIRNHPAYAFVSNESPVLFWSMQGETAVIATVGQDGVIKRGPFYGALSKAVADLAPAGSPRLVILDTVSDIYSGSENDRGAVNQFVKACLGSLAKEHNATGVLIGHPPKSEGTEYSGSTAWNNAFRARWFLERHEKETLANHRVLKRSKSNYAGRGDTITMEYQHGCLVVVAEADIRDDIEAENMERVYAAIDAENMAGKSLSLAQQSGGKYLKKREVIGAEGKPLSWEEKNRLTIKLIELGRVEEVTGEKNGNGLYALGSKREQERNSQ